MKKPLAPVKLLATAILCCIAATPLFAESAPVPVIKEIKGEFLGSPDIPGYAKKGSSGKKAQWLEVDVKFDMPQKDKDAPKFGDELTVNYFILLNNKVASEDGKATLLTGAITHVDIHFDKDLHVGAFVSPQTLARFFNDNTPNTANQAFINIGVTISDATGVIARHDQKNGDIGTSKTPWWENSDKYNVVSDRVLSKDATPFAHLAWDYFQPLKAK
jgi:hypothetical protein